MSTLRVFVYGTLMPGERGYEQLCARQVIGVQAAIAPGQLYELPEGYPAMTTGRGWVQGFLLEFSDHQVLPLLDDYEDYHPDRSLAENLYQRQLLEIFTPCHTTLNRAWVYLMSLESIRSQGGRYLPSGQWS